MHLKKISISRYRGIQRMVWHPSPGTNCLIGPADSGKSTILAALSLLLSPRPFNVVSEFDYHHRRVEEGFEIDAVIAGVTNDVLSSLRLASL